MISAEKRLDERLREFDDRSRPERIKRIVWLAEHEDLPGAIMGRTETLQLLKEAREVFINGHFVAALLLAISVINHSLVEELQLRGDLSGDPGLKDVLTDSDDLGLLKPEWVTEIRQLVARRHPFVHLKESNHKDALGARIRREKTHPAHLLEEDAQKAIMYMYRVFRETLRAVA